MRLFFISFLLCWVIALQGQNKWGHMIPEQKDLSADWITSLTTKGERTVYQGEQLNTIGMPCGGIAAGQLYVRGDGSLANWWIANNAYCTNGGEGASFVPDYDTPHGPWEQNYQTFEPKSYFDQGFAIRIKDGNDKKAVHILSKKDFDAICFRGEYPLASIEYNKSQNSIPVNITSQVFSPFIPLDAKNSSLPATIIRFNIENNTTLPVEIELIGWLQNLVFQDLKYHSSAMSRNNVRREDGSTSIIFDAVQKMSVSGYPQNHPYWGNMTLTLLEEADMVTSDFGTDITEILQQNKFQIKQKSEVPLGNKLLGAIGRKMTIMPGEKRSLSFVLTWYFPNRCQDLANDTGWDKGAYGKPNPTSGPLVGNMYANWFDSSYSVSRYIKENWDYLTQRTLDFHQVYYRNTTLPYWLKQRCIMPVANLATETCQWHKDGRFWTWEGVGSCYGTCTHVWGYDQALVRFFPSLDSLVRVRQDLGISLQKDGGIVTRGVPGRPVHIDGHASSILKVYRMHLQSDDFRFLKENYEKVKRASKFLIDLDGNNDGILEGIQPNTYDIAFTGANGFISTYYLASLMAMRMMALDVDDTSFAQKCQNIINNGRSNIKKRLWNGEYFIQDIPRDKIEHQYWDGCLSDQLLGQTWCSVLGLGNIYPVRYIHKTLESIWKYNWKEDLTAYYQEHPPERCFADAGEAGLVMCTWPKSEHPGEKAVRYKNEVWTGIEHQVATCMIYYGMYDQALQIEKGIHQRYNGIKHNPWNEVEAGDHYVRSLASWGVFIALEDYLYNGPEGKLSFSPQIQKNKFSGFFTTAKAWGTINQTRTGTNQVNSIYLKYGRLKLRKLRLDLPSAQNLKSVDVFIGEQKLDASFQCVNNKVEIVFEETQLSAEDKLVIEIKSKK